MHPLEKATCKLIVREGLLAPAEIVIVGCSAGPDSMALLHVLSAVSLKLAITPVAVYVDHNLRPEETGRERDLVAARSEALGLAFQSFRVNAAREAEERKMSIEHAARELRYSVFERLASGYGAAARIAVAHTADDQAEEVLLRLIRGTGRAGLSGMKMIRDGRIIRPFLNRTKVEILAYLKRYDIPWLEDSSNSETRFLRNRLRLEVIPRLAGINPNISGTLRRTAGILQDEELVLNRLTEEAWQELVISDDSGSGKLSIRLPGFLALERGIQRRLLEKAFIWMTSRPQGEKIQQILNLAATGETGARLHFSRGLRLKKARRRLLFSYPVGRIAIRG
ncbi:MAG: tRNA lysidine(34) synthetase TilS [Thermodesulfobacteriota bacterium]